MNSSEPPRGSLEAERTKRAGNTMPDPNRWQEVFREPLLPGR